MAPCLIAEGTSAKDNSQLRNSQASNEIEKEALFYERLANVVLKDDENKTDAEDQASNAVFASLSEQAVAQEKNKLDVRRSQAIMHLSYTDARIRILEEAVMKLRQDLEGLPEDFEVLEPLEHPVHSRIKGKHEKR